MMNKREKRVVEQTEDNLRRMSGLLTDAEDHVREDNHKKACEQFN